MVRARSKCGAATQACGRASADKAGGMSSAWSGLLRTHTVRSISAVCNTSYQQACHRMVSDRLIARTPSSVGCASGRLPGQLVRGGCTDSSAGFAMAVAEHWRPPAAQRAHGMLTTMTIHRFLSAAVLATLAACSSLSTRPEPAAPTAEATQQVVLMEALNPDVRQDTIQQTICTAGYTASVRPSTTYTNGVKAKLLRERGQTQVSADEYELDHIVPLALGGHPRNLKNLMLQSWEGDDGAKRKDRLERRLQVLVCSGKLLLNEARSAIYFDWQGAYVRYVAH